MFGKNKKLHQSPRYGMAETPSAHELTLEKYYAFYNRITAGDEQINALVLGATPELRDIILSYGHKLTTVDHHQEALRDKTALMHFKGSLDETIIVSDWLSMDFPENTFDVILGDGVLTTLKNEDQKNLLKILNYILKPTGSILLREEAKTTDIKFKPEDIVHNFRTGKYNLFDLFFGLRLHNKNYIATDPKSQNLRLQDFLKKLKTYQDNNIISDKEYHQLESIAEELEHTLLSKTEIEKILHSHFSPREIIHDIGSGHLSPWYFFFHQPKKQ